MRSGLFFLIVGLAFGQKFTDPNTLAPVFGTPQPVVEKMLALADVKPGETVYDLGCGDGRILIAAATKFHAKAVGVEIRREIAENTTKRIAALGLQEQVRIIHGDALRTDLSKADVVTLYLLTSSNDRVKPILQKYLRASARVVSHDYEIHGWKADTVEKLMVNGRTHTIYVYHVQK